MSETDAVSLLLVVAAAVAAGLVADSLRRLRVSLIVVAIGIGICLGPWVLGIVQATPLVRLGAQVGVTCLFFLMGYETWLIPLPRRALALGIAGWLVSFAAGLGAALGLRLAGASGAAIPLGLALATTAPVLVLPFLRDAGVVDSRLGPYLVAAGAAAQFASVACLALLLGVGGSGHWLIVLTALAITAAAALLPDGLVGRCSSVLSRRVRLTSTTLALGIATLVYAVAFLGLSSLPASFALGLLTSRLVGADERATLRSRLNVVGFGVLVPIFPIVAGVRFDLRELTTSPLAGLLVISTALMFLLVRGLSAPLYAGVLSSRECFALASFSATPLPLVMIITTATVRSGGMTPLTAAILVAAAMLSMLAFPALGLRLTPFARQRTPASRRDGSQPPPLVAPSRAALSAAVPETAAKEER